MTCTNCGETVYEHGTGEILSVGRRDDDGADSAVCPDGYLHDVSGR